MLVARDALLKSMSMRTSPWQPMQDFTAADMLTGQTSGDREVHRALEQLLVGNVQVGPRTLQRIHLHPRAV